MAKKHKRGHDEQHLWKRKHDPLRIEPDPTDETGSAERTELAWTRSGLALLACFAILARKVWASGTEKGDVLAVVLLGLATLGWSISVGFGTMRSRGRDPLPLSPAKLFTVALSTVAVGMAGMVIAFVNT